MIIDVLEIYPITLDENGNQIQHDPEIVKQDISDDYLKKPFASEQRKQAYQTLPIIVWENGKITVDTAAGLWLSYSAEQSPKAERLSALITEAKANIREMYPD